VAIATPTRERAPPTIASKGGTSSSRSQPSKIVMGGTRNVVTPNLPAVLCFSAYAQVEKATAVGTSPR